MKKKFKKIKTSSFNNPSDIPQNLIKNKISEESDIIVHSIIEKILSLTISTSLRNRIENEIPEKCFSYIKEFLSNKLLMEFLPHDIDDYLNSKNPNDLSVLSNKFGLINSSYQDLKESDNSYIINKSKDFNDYNNNSVFNLDQVLYNNSNKGENSWDIIEEPKSNKYDSYSSTMVKFKQIKKQEIVNNKNKKGVQMNNLEEVKEEETFSKSNINNKEKDNKNNTENDKKNESIKKLPINLTKRKNLIIPIPTVQVRKKRNDVDINQFPYEDLENDDFYIENNNEIDYTKLRKEIIELEQAKLKEEKKINRKTKSIDIKQIIGEPKKQYYGKNVTVDPNGEIVHIKRVNLNHLMSEFKYPKTILKNVKQQKKVNKKNEKKENKENKENINNEEKVENIKENIIRNESDSNEIIKQKDINNIIEQLKPISKRASNILPKISQKKLNVSIKTDNSEIKKIKREPVFPSGSNFELINLEIGVSIKEDEKFKTGGKDFFKKFNKYSKDIYNEKLKESMAANSFLNTKTQFLIDETNKFKTESNFEHTYGGFNMTMNQQDNSIQKDANSKYLMTSTNNFGNYNYISNIIGSNNFFNNNIMSKTTTHNMNQSSLLNPSIKLSNISSLVGSMDKLNLITEKEERFAKKNNNIFKNNKAKKIKKLMLNNFNEMDEFTKQILKTGDFTSRDANLSLGKNMHFHGKNPEKPSLLELTREIGYKSRPFRNRSRVNPTPVNPAMKTVAFFKQ